MMLRLEGWCIYVKQLHMDETASCSRTWIKQPMYLLCRWDQWEGFGCSTLCLRGKRQLLSCSGCWRLGCSCKSFADLTGAFVSVLLCPMGHTALNEERSKQRTSCGLLQGRERVVLIRKPSMQRSREGRWGGATVGSREECVPKKNISRRQRLFHFLIENEFNIYSIQTNVNLEGVGELTAKDVSNQLISRTIFVKTKLCGM